MCNAVKIRGDDIKKHFQTRGNLLALDQANTHQSELRKNFKASDSVAVPDEFLTNLLISDSEEIGNCWFPLKNSKLVM